MEWIKTRAHLQQVSSRLRRWARVWAHLGAGPHGQSHRAMNSVAWQPVSWPPIHQQWWPGKTRCSSVLKGKFRWNQWIFWLEFFFVETYTSKEYLLIQNKNIIYCYFRWTQGKSSPRGVPLALRAHLPTVGELMAVAPLPPSVSFSQSSPQKQWIIYIIPRHECIDLIGRKANSLPVGDNSGH